MFKNRKITVTMDKVNKENDPEALDDSMPFEEKTVYVLTALENIGRKAFLGLCIYVILDTHRQVSVAKASYPKI